MGIVLRWQEEPFRCEFREGRGEGTLNLYVEGQVVWREAVRSAASAYERAREVREMLYPQRARRA